MMSARHAVATNMFAVLFMTVSATARFARAGLIKSQLLWPLGVITALTSAFGALIAVKLAEPLVKAVVGLCMGALVLFMIVRKVPAIPALLVGGNHRASSAQRKPSAFVAWSRSVGRRVVTRTPSLSIWNEPESVTR